MRVCARPSRSRSAPTISNGISHPERSEGFALMNEEHDADCGCEEYQSLSRRQFIGGAAGLATAAAFPEWLPKVVLAETHASARDTIVSVFQRGGADGLSMCAPYADANYYIARPALGIPRPDSANPATKGIALDNFFAFP